MRKVKFWVLLIGSILVCALYLEQIYLSRSILHQQKILVEAQQFVSLTPSYESSWKQLATRVYEMSLQDDALADVLKRNQISVQVKPSSPSSGSAPQAAPAPAPTLPASPTKTKPKSPGAP
jgi:hypothetical protein